MIRVEALGGLRIFVGDQESVSLAKQRLKCALVVFLAVERSALRESVLNTFWPDREPERARHALSQTLYELRKILGDDWLSVTGDRMTVAEHVRCDVVDFITAVDSGEIQSALRAYGGSFLANCYLAETREFEEWSDRRQERVTKLLRRALREASQLEETPPWIDDAIEAARRAAEQSPTDDDVQHALLQLLVRAGRRSDALAQYERYQAALVEDKLEPLEHTKQLIATIRDSAETPAPPRLFTMPERSYEPPHTDPQQQPAPKPETKFPIKTVLGVLLLLATAALVPWLIGNARGGSVAAKASMPSIAVRPFDDLSPRDTFQYFANALTEGLIDELSQVPGLQVLSKSATQLLLDRRAPSDSLESDLRVQYLVEGSTDLQGQRLQVNVRLVDDTGKIIRRKSVQGSLRDLQALRNEVVEEVAVLFRTELGNRFELTRRRAETRNTAAFDLYLRAKQRFDDFAKLLLSKDGVSAAAVALKSSDSLLALAEQRDRNWNAPVVLRGRVAAMHAQIAMFRPGGNRNRDIRNALDSAIRIADRAVKGHPDDAESYALRGELRYRIWFTSTIRDSSDYLVVRDTATADLQRAVRMDPSLIEAQSALSHIYLFQARYAEARLAARRAYDLDRYYLGALNVLSRLAAAAFEQGLEEEASSWCKEGERRYPQLHQFLDCRLRVMAWGSQTLPDIDSTRAILDRSAKLQGSAPGQNVNRMFQLMAASVYARAKKREEALAILARNSDPRNDNTLLWMEAAARARLGQTDSALSLVQRVARAEPFMRVYIMNGRALEPLSAEPGFAELKKPAGQTP